MPPGVPSMPTKPPGGSKPPMPPMPDKPEEGGTVGTLLPGHPWYTHPKTPWDFPTTMPGGHPCCCGIIKANVSSTFIFVS